MPRYWPALLTPGFGECLVWVRRNPGLDRASLTDVSPDGSAKGFRAPSPRFAGRLGGGAMEGLGWGLCFLRLDISTVGTSHSSPPSPMISGFEFTNLTASPFPFLILGGGSRGRTTYSCVGLGSLAAVLGTLWALGYRGAVLVSSLVSTGGTGWVTCNLSVDPCKKSFRSPSSRVAFRSRSRPKSLPMMRRLRVARPSSCTPRAGDSFSVISVECCSYLEAKLFTGRAGA